MKITTLDTGNNFQLRIQMGQSIHEWTKSNFLKAVYHKFYLVHSWILDSNNPRVSKENIWTQYIYIHPSNFASNIKWIQAIFLQFYQNAEYWCKMYSVNCKILQVMSQRNNFPWKWNIETNKGTSMKKGGKIPRLTNIFGKHLDDLGLLFSFLTRY